MKKFKGKIKEKGNDRILTPEYWGPDETTAEDVEKYWGVHDSDIEWFEIEQFK